ncbi:hypothetical protein niasHS_016123 [Heterodera schachtii]|uniref:Uncharacterized protein n=1 Tax=Heterodera schachtii TaxID=97005 RepID=A0ABD2HTV0_HETSC
MAKKITLSSALFAVLLMISLLVAHSHAGPAAYGVCQAGCAAVVVACYGAAGVVFGTITAGVGTPPAIMACNAAYGSCQAACWAALFSPTL